MGTAGYPRRPWLGVLRAPRETIRAIVDADPGRWVWVLAALAGLQGALGNLLQPVPTAAGMPPWTVHIAALLLGAVQGLIALVVSGFAVNAVARWFGGRGTVAQTRAALAWSSLPVIGSIAVSLPVVLMGWAGLPGGDSGLAASNSGQQAVHLAVAVAASLAATSLAVATVAEVQQFSILRAFGTLLLAAALVLVALVLLWWAALLVGIASLLPRFRWSF